MEIGNISSNSAVRTCSFSYSANLASYSTDQAMKQECEIFVVDAREDESFSKFFTFVKFIVAVSLANRFSIKFVTAVIILHFSVRYSILAENRTCVICDAYGSSTNQKHFYYKFVIFHFVTVLNYCLFFFFTIVINPLEPSAAIW